jgi:anthranilate phosphoribosyltransferase
LGLKRWPIESLKGGDATMNKEITLKILNGEPGGPRDVTVINAAAALKVSGLVKDLKEGVKKAIKAIDSGSALKKLNEMIEISKTLDYQEN